MLRSVSGGGGAGLSVLRSYIAGCTLSNDGGTPNTKLDVAAGQVADDSNAAMMTSPAGIIDCTTVGVNGLDAGALANSTWYHIFVIAKAGGASPALLASTSVSAPALPATYTLKRRIGSFLTDGSAHILAFTQIGDTFYWSAVVTDVNANTADLSAGVLFTLSVPPGVPVRPLARVSSGGGTVAATISSPSETNVAAPANVMINPSIDLDAATTSNWHLLTVLYTNTSAQIRVRGNTSSGLNLNIFTRGWIDDRGRLS